ncbi:MAG: UvrD-helicase domain-containing protein [Candidatus Accumulibacter sp.]|jgi:DNA helicase-2/ATP-dependent DNA helicase PcrA|nr:UvrD-helicase domain-containing protein [Accumulibacter sp.]
MHDFLDKLNPEQRAAVTLPAQHALILAGAGSGKTRVLTTRIAWLLATGKAFPREVMAVTFTNKAAKEMLARVSAMLPINARGMWIGTFHGLCNRFLRAHHREAELPLSFQILDASDQLSAVKRLLKTLNLDEEKFPPREIAHFINAHKEQGLRAANAEAYDEHTKKRVAVFAEYDAQCQREGVVDFAELLLRTFELMRRNEPLRTHYQARFRHILVDEFQDTNRLQYAWLKLLAGGYTPPAAPSSHAAPDAHTKGNEEAPARACLFAVGDDDQSIYAFRGADVGNMRDLEREFHIENVIRLEQNYRSFGNILDAANALIKNNRGRLGKNLWTDSGAGERISVFECATDLDEARRVVNQARERIRAGVPPMQIAFLYRSNAQSRVLEHQLFSSGVSYRVYGGQRFFDRQEIRHALAYLRLLANPDDDSAFLRVVNFPTRGIGGRSVEALVENARLTHSSLYNAAATLAGKAGASVANFIRLVEALRDETRAFTLPEAVETMLDKSGLREHYLKEKEGRERLENLNELVSAATSFLDERAELPEEESGADPLAAFLAYASLESGEHQAGEKDEAVQLMTVHAAKGLEFDEVFITGLEEGLFPHENSAEDRDGLEEERRLMYVAITRARKRLYLSYARARMLHGQTRYGLPSSFFDEIPENLLKKRAPLPTETAFSMRGNFARASTRFSGEFSRDSSRNSSKSFSNNFSNDPGAPRSRRNETASFGKASSLADSDDVNGFRIGQSVAHAKFGQGVIVSAEGYGSDARVQVEFGRAGTKWLSLAYAQLTPI